MLNNIDIVELFYLKDINIIDIRNSYYYNMGHIDGAINIPYYNLLNNYKYYLNKNNIYYLYCDTGEQSLEVVNRLNSFGYFLININGGYEAYVKIKG